MKAAFSTNCKVSGLAFSMQYISERISATTEQLINTTCAMNDSSIRNCFSFQASSEGWLEKLSLLLLQVGFSDHESAQCDYKIYLDPQKTKI
jgi:hypothetical protein